MVKLTQRKESKANRREEHKEEITIQTDEDPIVNLGTSGFEAKSSFHNHMNIQLFGLEICIVYNKYMGAATFAPIDEAMVDKRKETQLLATRYFFSQFWCEFTAAIMKEFHEDDVVYRQ